MYEQTLDPKQVYTPVYPVHSILVSSIVTNEIQQSHMYVTSCGHGFGMLSLNTIYAVLFINHQLSLDVHRAAFGSFGHKTMACFSMY